MPSLPCPSCAGAPPGGRSAGGRTRWPRILSLPTCPRPSFAARTRPSPSLTGLSSTDVPTRGQPPTPPTVPCFPQPSCPARGLRQGSLGDPWEDSPPRPRGVEVAKPAPEQRDSGTACPPPRWVVPSPGCPTFPVRRGPGSPRGACLRLGWAFGSGSGSRSRRRPVQSCRVLLTPGVPVVAPVTLRARGPCLSGHPFLLPPAPSGFRGWELP